MRIVKKSQLHFGEVNIADIDLSARSRDDIPAILKGLQTIYTTDEAREKVFNALEKTLPATVDSKTGRPGIELWTIFVLATLKLGLNCDFDRLQELANQHKTVRQMLGHSGWEDMTHYKLQTIIDNVSKLKSKMLADINQVIVEAGHEVVKKSLATHYKRGVTLLWLKPMSTTQQTSIYFGMPCAK